MSRSLEFWFEFASTYSYPAAMRVEREARAAGVAVAWRPFLLGPIFKAQGWNDSPFNLYPVKGAYMWRDLERTCDALGLAFRRPSRFPRNGLLAARVATAGRDEPWIGDFVRAVYSANFGGDREIADRETIAGVLGELGLPADELLAASESAETKERLRAATEEATRRGVFGAPTFIVGEELFWGNDRLEHAIAWARR